MTDQTAEQEIILAQTETTTSGSASTTTSTDTHTTTTGEAAATGDTHTTTVGVDEGAHKKVFPPFDATTFSSQLIWFAIAFGALYLIMSRIALPRIGSVIEERKSRIRRDLDEAERLKGETERALRAYEQAVGDARGNATKIAQETRDKLKSEDDAERERLDKEIGERLAKAEAQIKSATATAMGRVSEIATDTAETIVGELVGLKVDRSDITGAVNAVLKH